MNRQGFSLIELLIIVAIVSILAVALGFQFSGWIGSYNVESQTKNMYIDLMNARARAMGRNRAHFLTLPSATNAATYTIYEDTNPSPDGDGILQTGSDTVLPTYPKTVQNKINWTGATITFDAKGIISSFCSTSTTTSCTTNSDCPSGETCGGTIWVTPPCILGTGPCPTNSTCTDTSASCVDADYDCINLEATRIKMGKWDGASCVAK